MKYAKKMLFALIFLLLRIVTIIVIRFIQLFRLAHVFWLLTKTWNPMNMFLGQSTNVLAIVLLSQNSVVVLVTLMTSI